jgi:hypothetical protein
MNSGTFTIVYILIFGALFEYFRRKTDKQIKPGELRYPKLLTWTLIAGILFTGSLSLYILYAMFRHTNSTATPIVFMIFFIMTIGEIISAVLLNKEYFEYNEQQIIKHKALGKSQIIRWSDITGIQFKPMFKELKIKSINNKKLSISPSMLAGIPYFAKAILTYAPQAIDEKTRNEIIKWTEGKVPQLFG